MIDDNYLNFLRDNPVPREVQEQVRVMTEIETERKLREWPLDVNRLLTTLATKVLALECRVAELEAGQG